MITTKVFKDQAILVDLVNSNYQGRRLSDDVPLPLGRDCSSCSSLSLARQLKYIFRLGPILIQKADTSTCSNVFFLVRANCCCCYYHLIDSIYLKLVHCYVHCLGVRHVVHHPYVLSNANFHSIRILLDVIDLGDHHQFEV